MGEISTEITLELNSAGSLSAVTLAEDDYVQALTLQVISGSCTYQGSGTFRETPSAALTFNEGGSYTTTSRGPNAPLAGITITALGGITNLVLKK